MRRTTWLLLICGCVLAGGISEGCGTRDRANPLDPENPSTAGVAPALNAVAGHQEVTLAWRSLGIADLERVSVVRWFDDTDAETLVTLSPESMGWVDVGVSDGMTYEYRLRYRIRDDPTVHLSNSDMCTPGPERVWVVDEGWGGLKRVAPDGRDVAWRLPYSGYLRSLSVDRSRGTVWAVSWTGGEILGLDSAGVILTRIPVELPRRVAVDEADGSLWVAADWGVGWYSAEGELRYSDITVEDPKDIVLDPVLGTCWVAEGTGSLWIRGPGETAQRLEGFERPFSLSMGGDGDLWLVDTEARRVYRLDAAERTVVGSSEDFAQPVDVADASDGAWVADWTANAVVRLNDELETILRVSGFSRPRGVAPGTGGSGFWVVEARGGRVTRAGSDGEPLGSAGGLDFPKDIVVVDQPGL